MLHYLCCSLYKLKSFWFHSIPLDEYLSLHGLPSGFYPNPASMVRSVLLDDYQFFRLEPPLFCLAD